MPYLTTAAGWLDRALQSGGSVICHCHRGINRSAAAIVAYVLLHDRSMGVRAAIEYIRRVNNRQRGLPALTPRYNNFEKILQRVSPRPESAVGGAVILLLVTAFLVTACLVSMRYMRQKKNGA